ncbi:Retrovirus-related Pol polyprotein from transposon TNT 1-94 [Gossypium australe]|uniref:Retrovirus-related Pol polyprotein from transposon TNT 1-94 n=1 Tax=Gossypium australe TaxID=47621 RepID=A0A5B6VEU0_9ROSI|nr:Retrovirus-related Pol polyprotein from transposon TNT 1-94 [Gossypium australe]
MAIPDKEIGKQFSGFFYTYEFGSTRDRFIGYVDSDFAGDLDKIKSLAGYIFTIRGCTTNWKALLCLLLKLSTWQLLRLVKKLFG